MDFPAALATSVADMHGAQDAETNREDTQLAAESPVLYHPSPSLEVWPFSLLPTSPKQRLDMLGE